MKTALLAFSSLLLACTAQASGDLYYVQIDTTPSYILNNQTYDHNPTEVTDALLAQNQFIATTYGNMSSFDGGSTPAVVPFHVVHTNAILVPPPPPETPSNTPEPATWGMVAIGSAGLFFIRRKSTV